MGITTVSSMSDDMTPPPPPPEGTVPPPPPPPPLPAYGSVPPPPGGYGAPVPTPGPGGYSPVEAIKYGWDRFLKAPTQLLIPTLIVAGVAIGVQVVLYFLMAATLLDTDDCKVTSTATTFSIEGCDGPGFFTSVFAYAVTGFVFSLFISALSAGLIKAALDAVDGKAVNPGGVFAYVFQPNVLVTAAIIAALTFVGTLLCYVPGLIVGYLTVFAMFYVVDKNMGPVEAIKASVALTTGKFADTVVFYLLGIVVLFVGALLCGVGLLAAVPVVLAAGAYTFRRLHDEPVAPVG